VNLTKSSAPRRFRLTIAVGSLIVAILTGFLLLGWQLLHSSESDVYLAALDSRTSAAIVLASRPSTCDHGFAALMTHPSGLPEDLVDSFLAANAGGASPISLESLRGRFAIADGQALARLSAAGVSPAALTSDARGYIYLSRVGYSSDHDDALFCAEGKQGDLFHLHRQNGNRHLVQVIGTWMS
jgi:hypothetical protein